MSPVKRALTERERCADMVAEAIAAEREACAALAFGHAQQLRLDPDPITDPAEAVLDVASMIRKRPQP